MLNQRTEGNKIYLERPNGNVVVTLIETTMDKKTMLVEIDGELISDTIHIFEDEMVAASIYFDCIIIDCKMLSYISRGIVKFFLQLQHMMEDKDGTLILKEMTSDVKNVFVEMELEDMFDIR